MATSPDNYTGSTGGKIYAGLTVESSPMDWVPAVGTFTDISLNTLADVKPSGWPSNDVSGPFLNWAGGFFNPDFSALGALMVRGSGHLSPGLPVWGGNWAFDISTRRWQGCNVPAAPLMEYTPNSAYYNEYYESIVTATAGHPYVPHEYNGLLLRSRANGGGNKGSMISNFMPGGGGVPQMVHQFDLSSATAPPTRVINSLPLGGASSSYPMAAIDEARGGYWLLPFNGAGPMKFVKFSDWTVTTYTDVGYSTYADHALIYLPAPYDCLVGMGRGNGDNTIFDMWVCPLVNGVPSGFVKCKQVGTPPADGRCGGVWSKILSCVVSYEASRSLRVHRLQPPVPSALATGNWTWTDETLVGDKGQAPSNAGINTNSGQPYVENGIYSRFVECEAARCFIFCNGVTAPVQAWRLQGM